MAECRTTIQEIQKIGSNIGVQLNFPGHLDPPAGAYLQAWGIHHNDPLPSTLFPVGLNPGWFASPGSIPLEWRAGIELQIRSPLGQGFHLPPGIQRLGLLDMHSTQASFLIPVIPDVLESKVAVSVCASSVSESLPPMVELLPISAQMDLIHWADCVLISVSSETLISTLAPIQQELGRSGLSVQILVASAMPCGGIAECGLCAVKGTRHVMLACKDGPVFDFRDLSL